MGGGDADATAVHSRRSFGLLTISFFFTSFIFTWTNIKFMNFILSSLVNVTSYKWLAIFFSNVIYKYIKMNVFGKKKKWEHGKCINVWINVKPREKKTQASKRKN